MVEGTPDPQEARRLVEALREAQQENERLRAEVAELREPADRAAKSFLTAQGERDEAREECARLENRVRELAGVRLERFEATPGRADLVMRTNPVILNELAEMMIALLKDNSAPNYVSFAVNHPTGKYEMNCQRLPGVRPSEMAAQQRERAEKAEADLAAAVLREREECATLADEGRWAPTMPNGCCVECGSWTPDRHPERHDHKPSCSWSGREFSGDPTVAAAIRARSK